MSKLSHQYDQSDLFMQPDFSKHALHSKILAKDLQIDVRQMFLEGFECDDELIEEAFMQENVPHQTPLSKISKGFFHPLLFNKEKISSSAKAAYFKHHQAQKSAEASKIMVDEKKARRLKQTQQQNNQKQLLFQIKQMQRWLYSIFALLIMALLGIVLLIFLK